MDTGPPAALIEDVDACIAAKGWNTCFPPRIEALYRDKLSGYRARAMLRSIAPSIACYNVFLPADWILVPATAWLATVLHAAITGWFLIAACLFRSRIALATRELIGVSMPIFMVLQVLCIYVLNGERPAAIDYQYLAVMIVVFMNVNLRPGFRYAFGASLLLVVVYCGVLLTSHAGLSARFVGVSTMAAAAYLTLVANYRMERDARHAFLRRLQDRLHREKAELDAGRDPLTGLHNRRHLYERAAALWAAVDGSLPMAVLMIDVDHFKAYNDRFGHLAGDLCLKNVAAIVTSTLKDNAETCVRFGGEEFVVLLPDTELGTAIQSAERMRRAVEGLAILHEDATCSHVAVSIGVAAAAAGTSTLRDLIGSADASLYAAKRSGRNRVWPPFVTSYVALAEERVQARTSA